MLSSLASATYRKQFSGRKPFFAKWSHPGGSLGLTTQPAFLLQLAILSLQDVNIEDLYKGGEQAMRFTFYQRSMGSAFRLEAAAWPGWFLCGPANAQEPIGLTKETEPSARIEFYFEQSR